MIGLFRRTAQRIRHAPGLRAAEPLWKAMRAPYQQILALAGGDQGVPVSVGGETFFIDPALASVSWESIEPDSYRMFLSAVRPNSVVFDIGAHIGTYSILAWKRLAQEGRVVAFEPNLATRLMLEAHIRRNKVSDRYQIRDACCGLAIGTTDFYVGPDGINGDNGMLPREGFSKQTVPVTTLDAEIVTLGLVPTLLKIDVEGAEWDVLRGGEKTLRSARPSVLLSLHPQPLAKSGVTEATILDWLTSIGYSPRILSRDHEVHVWLAGN